VSDPGSTRNSDWWHEHDDELCQIPGRLLRLNLTNKYVRGLFEWVRKDNSRIFIAHCGNEVYRSSDGITWTLFHMQAIDTAEQVTYDIVMPDDILMWADGVNVVATYDGTTVAPLALPIGVTNARIVRYFKARTILVDVVSDGVRERQRIWWSQPLEHNLWDSVEGANFTDYAEGGGGVLQAVIFNDSLVLFKESRLGVLNHTAATLDVPFRLSDFAQQPGTIYPFSVVVSPRGILYFTPDGVRQFDGERTILVTGKTGLQMTTVPLTERNQVTAVWDARRLRYLLATSSPQHRYNCVLWEVHFDESELSQLLRKATVYKRSQNVTAMEYVYYDRPYKFNMLVCKFSEMGVEFDDPVVVASVPVLLSGNGDGDLFEHEVTAVPDAVPYIELGPFPKDPLPTAQLSKRLSVIRLRASKHYNSVVQVQVRPLHREDWVTLRNVNFGVYEDGETVEISADGIEGEQFYVRFVRIAGQPCLVNCLLMGTTLANVRRTRAA